MKFGFHSIRTRLMFATTLLIVLVVGAVVWMWTSNERAIYREQKEAEARSFALVLATAFMNELDDENWSQVRIAAEVLLADNRDFAYVLVHDARKANRVIAAAPMELADSFVPDVVRADVTRSALNQVRGEARAVETFTLRDIRFLDQVRAAKGERVVEVAAPIRLAGGDVVGTFRVGISLAPVDRAVANALTKALGIGALSLLVGLIGAFIVAERMSRPIGRLAVDASQIADGDLEHRAAVGRADEIGALAGSFNDMTSALQASFGQLRKTLDSFERFVPRKFLEVIATEGIENIQVGVASHRRISVLFSDIRGWTSLSEGMQPMELFDFLNDYLAAMGEAINAHGGFIDKYIGDAIMALFDESDTDGALQAALHMRRTLAAFNAERARRGLAPVDAGIGIHTGEVIMGTVGFSSRIDSTVIGDPVNLASRVEGLTKEYACAILVTDGTVAALTDASAFDLELIAEDVRVKGKDEPISLYQLKDAPRAK